MLGRSKSFFPTILIPNFTAYQFKLNCIVYSVKLLSVFALLLRILMKITPKLGSVHNCCLFHRLIENGTTRNVEITQSYSYSHIRWYQNNNHYIVWSRKFMPSLYKSIVRTKQDGTRGWLSCDCSGDDLNELVLKYSWKKVNTSYSSVKIFVSHHSDTISLLFNWRFIALFILFNIGQFIAFTLINRIHP